jgi:hypothetical protein
MDSFLPEFDLVITVIILSIVAILYTMPASIAHFRKHRQAAPILWTNLLLGWTVIGWIGTLIWASTSPGPSVKEKAEMLKMKAQGVKWEIQGWDPDASRKKHGSTVKLALSWGLVGLPLAWGIEQTLEKALLLFR